jgi:WD40 repeat protein
LFFLFLVSVAVNGQQASSQPILRIETGMHIGAVKDVSATDAGGAFLVTASEDKTVRVWQLSDGKLLSVLRPQIGDTHEGVIHTAAISPDGKTIAVGGVTGDIVRDFKFSVYLFDRESGRIVKRIADLPRVIMRLAYSPDGKYLAAVLGDFSLQLYEADTLQLVAEDKDAASRIEFLDFDSSGGRIVTASFDGFVRVYEIKENKLILAKKQTIKGGKVPITARFSPDGARIAVGFFDTLQLKVVSSSDLNVLYEPDISKTSSRELGLVAWSKDGRTLYAAGRIGNEKGINPICYWTNDGREYGETDASISSFFDLEPLPGGGVAFGGGGPAVWGVLDADKRRTIFTQSAAADFRDTLDGILVDKDAAQIRFSFERNDRAPALFSIPGRRLEIGNNTTQNLQSPQPESNKLKITGWRPGGREPALNGRKLQLLNDETSFSLSILPNGKNFVLGTGWYLRLFDNRGEKLWQIAAPAIPWSINNDKTGKITVAAFADGTVHWYRTSDGQELLAFFSPNDKSGRWILWTPSGYYDASPDAEDFIGWHVNNGADAAADFFPNHLFRAYFYRPDIIDAVLRTGDESLAIKYANEKANRKDAPLTIAKVLPPVVEFNASKTKEITDTTVKISYKIRNHSGEPVTAVKALIDGREQQFSVNEKIKTADGTSELTVQVPRKDSELTLIAENKFTKSIPAKIKLKWRSR